MMDHRIYATILILCFAVALIVYVIEDSGIVKRGGPPATVGGWALVIGFLDLIAWAINYIWS